MTTPPGTRLLHQLAQLHGMQTAYYDVTGQRQSASAEALLASLQAFGAPVTGLQDVPTALWDRRRDLWEQTLEPVAVAWDGGPATLEVRLPSGVSAARLVGHLTLETGEERRWEWQGEQLPPLRSAEVNGTHYVARQITLPAGLPLGYHRLTLELPGRTGEALVVAAPSRAFDARGHTRKTWGVFLPLYALHSQKSWGAGDLADLEGLMEWTAGMGGSLVGSLPLLPTFLNEPFDPSPYAPVSRLLWNEFFLDVARIPELQRCPSARALMESPLFQEEVATLRKASLVDYRRQMALKRRLLEELAGCCFADASARQGALWQFARVNPPVDDYARFRATMEKRQAPWHQWPEPFRQGASQEEAYDEESRRYHLYVQWVMHQQMEALAEKGRQRGVGLYLDLPLGIHPDGYDTWREQRLFVSGVAAGSPPDSFFTHGQNWGFPPFHPQQLRQQGYSYFIACLRHHLQYARVLRLDHVMGLHRLFWVPRGMEPRQGVYVRYPAEELYAILALESHRHKAMVVGEDLGTVPRYVRPAMARHGLQRMYVVQYELSPSAQKALPKTPANAVASLNTHDMPTFSGFWQGVDIRDRREMGLLDSEGARQERRGRQALKRALGSFLRRQGLLLRAAADPMDVLRATLAFLGASASPLVLVNLEDLWLEARPQNVPGATHEHPNWQRKALFTLEEFPQIESIVDTLQAIRRLRS